MSAEKPAVSWRTPVPYGCVSPDGFHRPHFSCVVFVFVFDTVVFDKCCYPKDKCIYLHMYFMVSSQEQHKDLIFWHDVSTIIKSVVIYK